MAKKQEVKKSTKKVDTKKTNTKTRTKKKVEKEVKEIKKVSKEEIEETKKEVKKEKEEVNNSKKDKGIICAIIGIILVVTLGVVVNLIKGVDHSNYRSGKVYASLKIKDFDEVILELDADTAPITVTNFIDLANSGYYDGLSFHRMIKGFMMQGGDPQGDGYGDNGNYIKGEFESNGHANNISHTKGTISMARGEDPDSASTQFFIVTDDSATFLDGNYAAFGTVINGIETIDKVMDKYATEEDEVLEDGKRPIIESIREIQIESADDYEYEE